MAPTIRKRDQKHLPWTFKRLYDFGISLLFEYNQFWLVATVLFLGEVFVNVGVILGIKYTEIDWEAYMSEVEGFLNGTYDYTKLEGATGPLVYPAGFVYFFSALYYVTSQGQNIRLAQYLYAGFYLLMISCIFYIYKRSRHAPPFVMFFICCASYRIHSIFVLRLFNDPIAMLLLYLALVCFLKDRWTLGCILFSLGVSIKMNVLLFAPGLAVLLMLRFGFPGTILRIALCGLIQLALGLPFLLTNPVGYIARSFNLGRQFFYIWTVNWRLIPEWLFLSRYFQAVLLLMHISFLLYFIFFKFPSPRKGCSGWLSIFNGTFTPLNKNLTANEILYALFVSNFIGMCFSRSLHYQFYVWYFHTLPFLLWSVRLPDVARLLILGLIEMAWNTYPSTVFSSTMLHVCHAVILCGLIFRENKAKDYTDNENGGEKRK